MGIRKKFLCLTMLAGLVLVLVSGVGYYNAQNHLSGSLEQKLDAVVDFNADEVDGWLSIKGQNAVTIGTMLGHLDSGIAMRKELTSGMEADSDLQEFLNGNEQGQFVKWGKSSVPADYDPRTRGWYKEAKAAGGLIFTDAYVDALTGKTVVTAAYPYKNPAGAFAGALCIDISLDVLRGQAEKMNLNGRGVGFILDKSGNVVAHADQSRVGKKLDEDPVFQSHMQEIMTKDNGRISYEKDGRQMILAYAKAHRTGWITGLEISEEVVYGDLASLKVIYGIIILIGILILTVVCLRFAANITRPILSLTAAADQLAGGDLRVEKVAVSTRDEIGRLTVAFNMMSDNLRSLIGNVSDSSNQIAAASEELTASAGQSAEASNHVAGTITEVAQGTADQMKAIGGASNCINRIAGEVEQVAGKTKQVSEISGRTAERAQKGETLMAEAIRQMTAIEEAVTQSAATVVRLGDNSKQIGQIVGVISGIAGQTNLLALNAAIEAARAGEQGKGFAVVAEEVRKLAEQSQQATEEISNLIASIQQDTAQAVQVMEMGTDEVKSGSEAIHNVGGAFQDIMRMVDEITKEMRGIAQSSEHLLDGSGEVVTAIRMVDDVSRKTVSQTETISAATEEQSASMEEIASSSQTLAQMAQRMQAMVKQFKL